MKTHARALQRMVGAAAAAAFVVAGLSTAESAVAATPAPTGLSAQPGGLPADPADSATVPQDPGVAENLPKTTAKTVALEDGKQVRAQNARATVPEGAPDPTEEAPALEGVKAQRVSTGDATTVGVTWKGSAPDRVELRSQNKDASWTPWSPLEAADERGTGAKGTEPFWAGPSKSVEVRASSDGRDVTADLDIVLVDAPSNSEAKAPSSSGGSGSSAIGRLPATVGSAQVENGASVPAGLGATGAASMGTSLTTSSGMPSGVISRAGWGADESKSRWTPSYRNGTTAGILHHTAGSNNYTAAQAAQQVRGIFFYHTVTLGWGDVGYNVLVDKYGKIYEGRRGGLNRFVSGAQAGGFNSETFGISILGSYHNSAPSSAAKAAVAKMMAWKLAGQYQFDANERTTLTAGAFSGAKKWAPGAKFTVPRIIGHRDVNLTSCPGDAAYAWLPALRNQVNTLMKSMKTPSYSAYVKAGGAAKLGTVRMMETPINSVWTTEFSTGAKILQKPGQAAKAYSASGTLLATGTAPATGGSSGSYSGAGSDGYNTRYGGANRYETAAAVSKGRFPKTGGTAYIATGRDFSDALAAGPTAARANAPILLASTGLPNATRSELRRLRPSKIIVVGGPSAVPESVFRDLKSYSRSVSRVAGTNRYATAAKVARSSDTVYLATGSNFPDSLAAGPVAAKQGATLLLSNPKVLSRDTATRLKSMRPRKVVLVGPTTSLRSQVSRALRGESIELLAGKNRYETAVKVNERAFPKGSSAVFMASGGSYADSMVAGAAAGARGLPLLLTRPGCLPRESWNFAKKGSTNIFLKVGGTQVVGSSAERYRCR